MPLANGITEDKNRCLYAGNRVGSSLLFLARTGRNNMSFFGTPIHRGTEEINCLCEDPDVSGDEAICNGCYVMIRGDCEPRLVEARNDDGIHLYSLKTSIPLPKVHQVKVIEGSPEGNPIWQGYGGVPPSGSLGVSPSAPSQGGWVGKG